VSTIQRIEIWPLTELGGTFAYALAHDDEIVERIGGFATEEAAAVAATTAERHYRRRLAALAAMDEEPDPNPAIGLDGRAA
jgi:hypothetical protein